ncbi:MAG: hypothetical protein KDC26_00870 [Armatimonadetes bacterium]|nr:hypothetical protein [Armatimonadota bacterium]
MNEEQKPPLVTDFQVARVDSGNLNTLSIFWYIVAGLFVLGSLVGIATLLFIGGEVASASQSVPQQPEMQDLFGPFLSLSFISVLPALIVTLLGGVLCGATGYCLRKRSGYILITIMSGISCLNIPLGTILGVLTLVEINKPEIKSQMLSK